jgi:hypothetical protein
MTRQGCGVVSRQDAGFLDRLEGLSKVDATDKSLDRRNDMK